MYVENSRVIYYMSRRAVAILIAGFFTIFTAYAIRYAYGMLLPEMLVNFHINKTQAGVIYSSYFIAYTVASPLMGILSDKYDTRKIISIFSALLALGALLMASSSGVLSASLYFAMAGFGSAACWTPVVVVIQRWVNDKLRGTAITISETGSAIGIAVWSALMPLIIAAFDWRAGWIALGASGFMVAILNFILVRDRPELMAKVETEDITARDKSGSEDLYINIVRDNKFWFIGISYLLVGFAVIVIFTFLPTYGIQSLNMSYASAAGLIIVISLAGIVGKIVLGPLSDKADRIIIMIICCILLGAGIAGIVFFKSQFCLFLFTAIFGIGYGAVWPLYAASAVDYFPRKHAGAITGLWTFFLGVGSIIGPVLSGWTIDITNDFETAFLLAAGAAVLSLVLLLLIKINIRARIENLKSR